MYTQGPVDQGCLQAGCYFKLDFLFLLSKVVTLKTTGCVVLGCIVKMRIRDVLCRQIPEKASFKWLPLLLVLEKIKPAFSAPFIPVAEMLQGVLGEFSIISAEICTVNGFGA